MFFAVFPQDAFFCAYAYFAAEENVYFFFLLIAIYSALHRLKW